MATLEERKAEAEKIRLADALSGDYTVEDWRHRCRMEPVTPCWMKDGWIQIRVRETGDVIEVLSQEEYDQVLEDCLA